MAKLVDARDLKSLGLYVCAGSTPALGTGGFLEGESPSFLNPHTPAKMVSRMLEFAQILHKICTNIFLAIHLPISPSQVQVALLC